MLVRESLRTGQWVNPVMIARAAAAAANPIDPPRAQFIYPRELVHGVSFRNFAIVAEKMKWEAPALASKFPGLGGESFFKRVLDGGDCVIPYMSVIRAYVRAYQELLESNRLRPCPCACGSPCLAREAYAHGGECRAIHESDTDRDFARAAASGTASIRTGYNRPATEPFGSASTPRSTGYTRKGSNASFGKMTVEKPAQTLGDFSIVGSPKRSDIAFFGVRDFTGKQFGNLTADRRDGTGWSCRCRVPRCRRVVTVSRDDLISGKTVDCGAHQQVDDDQQVDAHHQVDA